MKSIVVTTARAQTAGRSLQLADKTDCPRHEHHYTFIYDVESCQEMHRTTSQRMDHVQEDHRKSTPGQPDRLQHYTALFYQNHSADECYMHRVSFNDRVTVYPADDYDRKSPWMHMAIDRVRFRRRIHQSELILAPILNHKHRLMIRIKRYDI